MEEERLRDLGKAAAKISSQLQEGILKDEDMLVNFKKGADFIVENNYIDTQLMSYLFQIVIIGNSTDEARDWFIGVLEYHLKNPKIEKDTAGELKYFVIMLKILKDELTAANSGIEEHRRHMGQYLFETEWLIHALIKQNRMEEAKLILDIYFLVVKEYLVKDNSPYWGGDLAKDYFDIGDSEKSLELYENATKVDPFESDYWKGCGLCYEKLGKTELAQQCWKKIMSIKPSEAIKVICDNKRRSIQKKRLKYNQNIANEKLRDMLKWN